MYTYNNVITYDDFSSTAYLSIRNIARSSRRSLIDADLIAVKSERTSNASGQCAAKLTKRGSAARICHRACDRRRENRLSVWSRQLCCGCRAKLSSLVSALRFFHTIPITLAPSRFCCTQPRPCVPYTCTYV